MRRAMTDTALLGRQRSPHGRLARLIRSATLGFLGTLAAAVTFAAAVHYPGKRLLFLIFISAFLFMMMLALLKPRLYAYTFLATFLFLGFCSKTIAFLGFNVALVEPTGRFDGTGRAWDAALAPAIAGCAAIIVARLVHLVISRARRSGPRPATPLGASAPELYARMRVPILAGSVVLFISLNALNLVTATYQVGVSPRVILPGHLNVLAAWLLTSGLAIWVATLVGWETQLPSNRLGSALLVPLAEAIASASTLSRAAYLFRALPYLLVVTEFPSFFRTRLSRGWRAFILLLLPVGFLVSLALVSLLRIVSYPGPSIASAPQVGAVLTTGARPPAAASPLKTPLEQRIEWGAREISTLIIGRWIGVEGTMSVSSYPDLSISLLARSLRESPSAGEDSLFQHISGSSYKTSARYVFLTTPGAIAVLDYSGSLLVVFAGMALLTTLLFAFEVLASHLLANGFAVSLVAISLAGAVAQMDFPYLFFVLFLEQAVAVTALMILRRAVGCGVPALRTASVPSE